MSCGQCKHRVGDRCMRWVEEEEPPVVDTDGSCNFGEVPNGYKAKVDA